MYDCHGTAPSACTVLIMSHPSGVIYSPPYFLNSQLSILNSQLSERVAQAEGEEFGGVGVEADVEGGDGLAVFGRECLGGGVGVDPVGAVVADGAAGVAEGEQVDVAIDAETVGEAVGDHRHKPHVQLAEGVGGLEEDGAGGAGVVLGLLGVAPPKAIDGGELQGHGEGTEVETALPHEESSSSGHQGAVG